MSAIPPAGLPDCHSAKEPRHAACAIPYRDMPDLQQNQGRGGQPALGLVYNTSMDRPDAALALAALYVFASKMESRVNGVCVGGAGLDTAVFCDVVARF